MAKKKELVWKKSKKSLFETFAVELMESTKSKTVPTSGDQDLQYATQLWQDRLERKGLDLDYDFMNRGAFTKDDSRMHWKGSDDRYINSTNVRSCELTRTVNRDGKRIYKKADRKLFYQFSTDVKEGAAVGEDLYTCPNCQRFLPLRHYNKVANIVVLVLKWMACIQRLPIISLCLIVAERMKRISEIC